MKIFPNKLKLLETLSAFIGLTYIIYLLWLRLILVRLPRVLDGHYTFLQEVVFVILFLISLIILMIYLRKIRKKQYKNIFLNKIFGLKIYQVFYQYILEAPKNFYHWLLQYIVIRSYIEKIGVILWNNQPYTYCKRLVIFFFCLRILVAIIFLFDVFYFKILYYFYLSLCLILLSLGFNALLYILKDFSLSNRKHIESEFLIITPNETRTGFYTDPKDKYKDTLTDQQIQNLSASWVTYLANDMFVDKCYEWQDHYSKFVFIFCYFLYVLGWFSILLSIN